MPPLNKRNKAECKVIFILIVIALLLETVDKKMDKDKDTNPAVSQCTKMIEELFERNDEATQNNMKLRIQKVRTKFSHRVTNLGLTDGMVGGLRVLTGGVFKTKKGTRLDYIIKVFKENLTNIESHLPFNESNAQLFAKELKAFLKKL